MPRAGLPRPSLPRPGLPRTGLPHSVLFRLAVPGGVLLALVIVLAVATVTRPGAAKVTEHGSQAAAVTSVTRSCPPAAPGTAARIAMIAVPSQAAVSTGTATGTATFSSVTAVPSSTTKKPKATASSKATKTASLTGTNDQVTVSRPGAAATVTAAGGGTAVSATGKMAEGFEAEQAGTSGTGLVTCSHSSSDLWFVGTGHSDGAAQIYLYLMNTGNVPASADVTLLTDTGQQSGLSSALTVLPGQSVKENIAPLVSGSQALAVHVQTTTGQVSASVWESGSGGGSWLPQAAAPATTQVIPGLTVASSSAKLFVVVPGSTDAQLKVVAYTPAGPVPQFPGTLVDASAGAATPIALNSLGASAAGLKLTSNVPIVAGVLVPGTGIGSFTAAVAPVTEQGVIAGNPAARGLTVGLLLTAPAAAARASVSVIGADGTVTEPAADQGVRVNAGHTLALAVPRPSSSRTPFAIVITPAGGSGPLYAVRVVTSGTGGLSAPVVSLLPVQSALTSITLPPATDSYQAVLP
jgi:Family of unknown function (DUF5719)